MKILITGGSGFIGRNLNEYLAPKHEVYSPSRKELDLLDENAVKVYLNKNNFDIIIHGAVRPGHRNAKDASGQLFCNTRMFFNLARNSDSYGKMIYIGSGLVYDIRNYVPKMKEDYFDMHVPEDEGGFSKYIIAKYIEKSENIVELRVFGIFGKYEDYAIRFISNAICKSLFDMPITIKQNRKFDYIYITDLMPVIEHFTLNNWQHKSYNVTPDNSIELRELAEKVRMISGKGLPIKISIPGLGAEYSGDNSRMRSEIKSLKYMPVDTAIEDLYGWYSSNIKNIEKNALLFDK
ncbi:MAG: NAD(P)-dependent oxidoreductase [Candidatus Omnitrophota bacterium]